MKNISKIKWLGYAGAMVIATAQLSCSSDSKNTSADTTATVISNAHEGETAYTDFKNYVSTLDSNMIANMDSTNTSWQDQRAIYDEKMARLELYRNDFNATRQQEIDQLKNRYDLYWHTNRSGGKVANKINNTAADVQQAGEKVGNKVEQGAENVKQAAKQTGEDAKATANTASSRIDRAAENTAEDIDKAEDKVGHKIGTAAKNTARDVGKVGSKIGHAAEETGKDVKEGVEKGAKAVGKTADKAGQKVKDAFDGKKNNN